MADLDTELAAEDGWAVTDDGVDIIVTLGSSAARGQGGGQVVIEGIGDESNTSFADLSDAAVSLQINP